MIKRVGMVLLLAACAACHSPQENRGGRGAPPTPAELMARLDHDGDGRISKAEFDGPAEHFSQFDKNGDGFLEAAELPIGPPNRGGRRR